MKKALEDNTSLEEKINSLLDVLYGCPECGLNKCECGEAFMEEDSSSYLPPQCASTVEPSFPPSATPSNTPAAPQHPTQPSSGSSPWTPPPTPPCISCGEANFGPCPSSVCFACIPPLQIKPESNNSSPSRTPPGTPPWLRSGHYSRNKVRRNVIGIRRHDVKPWITFVDKNICICILYYLLCQLTSSHWWGIKNNLNINDNKKNLSRRMADAGWLMPNGGWHMLDGREQGW